MRIRNRPISLIYTTCVFLTIDASSFIKLLNGTEERYHFRSDIYSWVIHKGGLMPDQAKYSGTDDIISMEGGLQPFDCCYPGDASRFQPDRMFHFLLILPFAAWKSVPLRSFLNVVAWHNPKNIFRFIWHCSASWAFWPRICICRPSISCTGIWRHPKLWSEPVWPCFWADMLPDNCYGGRCQIGTESRRRSWRAWAYLPFLLYFCFLRSIFTSSLRYVWCRRLGPVPPQYAGRPWW